MMFQADAAFALELIAMGLGFWILVKARGEAPDNLKGFGSFIGYFIIVAAFLALLCTSYYSLKYWEDGHFNKPHSGNMMMMHGSDMMMGNTGMNQDQCKMMMGQEMDQSKCKQKKDGMKCCEKKVLMDEKKNMIDHSMHKSDIKDNS